jgi:DNA mismatch repair protein MutL
VRNLFFNVPARRNFLKSPATELKHLIDTLQALALSNPEIGFTVHHDDNEFYRLAPARDATPLEALRQRIIELHGADYAQALVPVEETTSYLSAHGFLGHPSLNRRSRGEQFLFVNGRCVKNRYLEHAVTSGYEQMLPEGAHPFFALFLRLDPRHLDVNVHPTKAEVKFDDERGVYGFVRAVTRKALGMADLAPRLDAEDYHGAFVSTLTGSGTSVHTFTPAGPMPAHPWPDLAPDRPPTLGPGSFSARLDDQREIFEESDAGRFGAMLYGPFEPSAPDSIRAEGPEAPAPQRDHLLWQLHDRYVLTQIHSGLIILDQNAAHERILYERALQTMESGLGLSQQLLFPHTVELNAADYELLKDLIPDLRSLGFDLELFSGRSVAIRGVPPDIRPGDERSILEDLIDQFKNFRDALQIKTRENLARSIAHRSAVLAGKRLTTREMRALIDQLFSCRMPYACPHGRPTMIRIPIEELDKRFGK